MNGRRCPSGCMTWPDSNDYDICPICDEKTSRFSKVDPITDDDANRHLLRRQFEDYYALHCRRQGQSTDGPLLCSPEESLKWDAIYPGGKGD